MPEVELIYDRDCPNVPLARETLMRAFAEAGLAARWLEWERSDPAAPPYVRSHGSPTILVDGRDVAGKLPVEGAGSCRLYEADEGGFRGTPPVSAIAEALRAAARPSGPPGRKGSLAAILAFGAALLPVGACPACLPAWAAVLGTLGFGVVTQERNLMALTLVFLAVSVAGLAWRARERWGFGPVWLGAFAAALVMVGKFEVQSDMLLYGGLALLLAAAVWNAWPRKGAGCPACAMPPVRPAESKPVPTEGDGP